MIKILVNLFILFFVNIALAKDGMNIDVAKADKSFSIILPANPTTGYQWQLKKYDKSILQLVDSQYKAANKKLIGSGGQMIYEFKLVGLKKPEQTEVQLQYARPWEKGKGNLKRIVIHFK